MVAYKFGSDKAGLPDPDCYREWIARFSTPADFPAPLPNHATLLWVFGCKDAPLEPANRAIELLGTGRVDHCIVTGGFNSSFDEALIIRDLFLLAGIPRKVFSIDCESGDTRKNVMNGRSILKNLALLPMIETIIVICIWYHWPRALMTLKRYMPTELHIQYFPYPYIPNANLT